MKAKRLYQAGVIIVIVLFLVILAGVWHLGANSMIACGFMGAFLIHLGTRPDRRQLAGVVAAGACFAASYVLFRGKLGTTPVVLFTGIGAFLGLGSILVLSFEIVWMESPTNAGALRDALILPVFSLVAGLCMGLTEGLPHSSYDYLLYAFESGLGIAPNREAARLFRAQPWIGTAASTIYATLLIFPPLYHAWALRQGRKTRMNMMYAFVAAGVVGYVLYHICPAIGPLYAFRSSFPDGPAAAVPLHSFISASVANAMPSMHMTWALLVWWAAWEIGPAAVGVASGFVTLTALATLGFGEHYLIDLFVAVPLVMAVEGICTRKHSLTIAGLALAFAWTALLRFGILLSLPAAVNWALIVVTVLATVAVMRPEWFRVARSPGLVHTRGTLKLPA